MASSTTKGHGDSPSRDATGGERARDLWLYSRVMGLAQLLWREGREDGRRPHRGRQRAVCWGGAVAQNGWGACSVPNRHAERSRSVRSCCPPTDRGERMAGLTVTVCLSPGAADDIDGALTAALAPFDQDSDNPVDRGMWDSRRIHGGSNGQGFAVVRGHEDDPRLVHDEPRYDGIPAPSAPGVCAGGPRALLDFSRPQAASERMTAAWRADYIREFSWVPQDTDVRTVDGWWRESDGSALHADCDPKSCPHAPRAHCLAGQQDIPVAAAPRHDPGTSALPLLTRHKSCARARVMKAVVHGFGRRLDPWSCDVHEF